MRLGHRRHLFWLIADVHSSKNSGESNQPSASERMQSWLEEIAAIIGQLKDDDDPGYILRNMLDGSAFRRVDAANLVKHLAYEVPSGECKFTRKTKVKTPKIRAGEAAYPVIISEQTAMLLKDASTTEENTPVTTTIESQISRAD